MSDWRESREAVTLGANTSATGRPQSSLVPPPAFHSVLWWRKAEMETGGLIARSLTALPGSTGAGNSSDSRLVGSLLSVNRRAAEPG